MVADIAGSDHSAPVGTLAVGGVAGELFVIMFLLTRTAGRSTDVLGVWRFTYRVAPGAAAAAASSASRRRAAGGVAFMPQLIMTAMAVAVAPDRQHHSLAG